MPYLIKFRDYITNDYSDVQQFLTDSQNTILIRDYIDLMAAWDGNADPHTATPITEAEARILSELGDVPTRNESEMREALDAVGWEQPK